METFVVSVYNDDSGMAEPKKMFLSREKAIQFVIEREGGEMDPEEIDELIVELEDQGMASSYQRSIENSYIITRMVINDDD